MSIEQEQGSKQQRTKAPKACLVYARVSTEEQKEGFSIPAQIELLVNYARKNNLRIVRIFEEAQSAKDSGRVEFNKMLKYLKAHPETNTILVEKTDRLYRNFKDYAILDDNKYEIHLVKENEVLSRESSSHQKLVHGLKVLLAKNFIDNLREETYKGRKKKAQEGYIVGACPYGYYKTDRMTALVNEEQAAFVRRAFEVYAEGHSLYETIKIMEEEGYQYQKQNNLITRGKLHAMLKSVVYTGKTCFEGVIYPGKFEAIISDDLYERVQVLLKRERESSTQYLFGGGLIRCARCGCAISGEVHKENYVYYRCSSNSRNCPQKRICLSEQYVYNAFARAMNRIKVTLEDERWLRKNLQLELRNVKFLDTAEHDAINTKIEEVKKNMSTLYTDKLDGLISEEFWLEKNDEMEGTLKALQDKLNKAPLTSEGSVEECMEYVSMLKEVPEMFEKGGFEIRKALANLVFERVTLKGRILRFKYAMPFRYFVDADFREYD